MKTELTYGDKCIIARNENEIRVLQTARRRALENFDKSIKALREQNRALKGRC